MEWPLWDSGGCGSVEPVVQNPAEWIRATDCRKGGIIRRNVDLPKGPEPPGREPMECLGEKDTGGVIAPKRPWPPGKQEPLASNAGWRGSQSK
jgi:hypothetical protein